MQRFESAVADMRDKLICRVDLLEAEAASLTEMPGLVARS
jgi:hypothetical protein